MLLKDPYILDFLGLSDRFLERDLEEAIQRELETFLPEMGSVFSFAASSSAARSTELLSSRIMYTAELSSTPAVARRVCRVGPPEARCSRYANRDFAAGRLS